MVGSLQATPWSITVPAGTTPVNASVTIVTGYLGNPGSVNTANPGGPEIQFTAYAIYSDGTVRPLPDEFGNRAVWSTTDKAVCTVSSKGLVAPISTGTCSVQAVTFPGALSFNRWVVTIQE
jgi:hypothetical protein